MTFFIQILIVVLLVLLVFWLMIQKTKLAERLKDAHLDRLKDARVEQLKDRVVSHKQINALRSRVDFAKDVLYEVQLQQDSISSYVKVLTNEHLQPGQQEWNEMVDHLKERSKLLKEMVQGTIKMLRYEETANIEKNETLTVNSFCYETLENCQQYVEGDVELRLETELEDHETISTNMSCLQTVLTNMLLCAIQFTHEGEIALEVKRRCQKKKQYLKFTVKDTGSGIPEDVKDVVFDRITGTNIDIKIIGVRLRLCKAITKLLDGSIYLDPSREKGTSVVLLIKI